MSEEMISPGGVFYTYSNMLTVKQVFDIVEKAFLDTIDKYFIDPRATEEKNLWMEAKAEAALRIVEMTK